MRPLLISRASLPAIGNLFLLWATLFLFYAILYVEVFGLTKMGNNAQTRFQNYYSFGNALVMLAFMSTGWVGQSRAGIEADGAAKDGTGSCTTSGCTLGTQRDTN